MAPTPLFHVTANNCILHPCTLVGGKIVFMHKWDAGRALELIERERVTNLSGVPTMSRELLLHPDWSKRDMSSLKLMGGGGAPLQPDLVDKIDKSLETAAPSTGYGLTETSRHRHRQLRPLLPRQAGVVRAGRADPRRQARRRARRRPAAPARTSIGELCVRGAVVIKGYLNRPEATADAIRDGWFRTGDIARIDEDGFVFIVDRAKDMVLRGGENVYCSEVEAAIYEHPDIAEAAVFGVPDERLGRGCRRRRRAARRRGADRRQICRRSSPSGSPSTRSRRRSGSAARPLPRNANGKFLKRELRSELLGRVAARSRQATTGDRVARRSDRRLSLQRMRCQRLRSAEIARSTSRAAATASSTRLHSSDSSPNVIAVAGRGQPAHLVRHRGRHDGALLGDSVVGPRRPDREPGVDE